MKTPTGLTEREKRVWNAGFLSCAAINAAVEEIARGIGVGATLEVGPEHLACALARFSASFKRRLLRDGQAAVEVELLGTGLLFERVEKEMASAIREAFGPATTSEAERAIAELLGDEPNASRLQ